MLRVTFKGKKMKHHLVAHNEEEIDGLVKKMKEKGYELECVRPFLERRTNGKK